MQSLDGLPNCNLSSITKIKHPFGNPIQETNKFNVFFYLNLKRKSAFCKEWSFQIGDPNRTDLNYQKIKSIWQPWAGNGQVHLGETASRLCCGEDQ